MNGIIKKVSHHNLSKDQKLLKGMKAFAYTAGVPVTLYDTGMNALWECCPELKICTLFMEHDIRNSQCDANLLRAVTAAAKMKEPYVFMCASGLTKIAYAITEDDLVKGTIFVGPIIMGKNREAALKHIFKYLPDFRNYANELLDLIEANRIRTSKEVSCLYEVFCDCIFSHKLMENNLVSDNSFTDNLLQPLRIGDLESGLASLELIFERAYIANGGNVNHIKVCLSDCMGYLSECLMSEVFGTEKYEALISDLKDASTIEEIHDACKRIIAFIVEYKYKLMKYEGKSNVIKEAIQYLKNNYMKDLELKEVAEAVHINTSYLSSLFKKETSMTFSQHLNIIRLNKSVGLLKTRGLTLEEIAKSCGFTSQNYFIRTFKQYYSDTPGKYRRDLIDKE